MPWSFRNRKAHNLYTICTHFGKVIGWSRTRGGEPTQPLISANPGNTTKMVMEYNFAYGLAPASTRILFGSIALTLSPNIGVDVIK